MAWTLQTLRPLRRTHIYRSSLLTCTHAPNLKDFKMETGEFVFLCTYQMEPYSKGAAMRGSKRKYFVHLWWEYDIWGIPQGCLDNRCSLNKNEKPMLPPPLWLQSGKRGRWSLLLSEKGLQRSHIILTGEAPGPIRALWGRTADILRHFSDLGMSWFAS